MSLYDEIISLYGLEVQADEFMKNLDLDLKSDDEIFGIIDRVENRFDWIIR